MGMLTQHRHLIAGLHTDQHAIPQSGHGHVATLFAGESHKSFPAHVELLKSKSPYFSRLYAATPEPSRADCTYTELDEYAFALFVRWLYGGKLHGPSDFHTLHHYLCLYVLALRFETEGLRNNGESMPTSMSLLCNEEGGDGGVGNEMSGADRNE